MLVNCPSLSTRALALLLGVATPIAMIGCSSAAVTGAASRAASKVEGKTTPSGEDSAAKTPPPEASQTKSSTDSADASGSDVPVWVNAAYLTCAWSAQTSATQAAVVCGLNDKDGKSLPPSANVVVAWNVLDDAGQPAPVEIRDTGSTQRLEQLIIAPSTLIAHLSVGAAVAGQPVPSHQSDRAVLASELPSLKDDKGLGACLDNGGDASDCLARYVPPTEIVTSDNRSKPPSGVRLFVTSTPIPGTLGGLSQADGLCRILANGASLSGTFIALLSTPTQTARSRIRTNTMILNIKGALIALNADQLLSGQLAPDALILDEHGAPQPATQGIWTSAGGSSGSCLNRPLPPGGAAFASLGGLVSAPDEPNCSILEHLYCIEQ